MGIIALVNLVSNCSIVESFIMTHTQTLREQLAFYFHESEVTEASAKNNGSQNNKLSSADRGFHDWYRFVLSYPPHLVRNYLQDFDLAASSTVLDPFCGTGTTIVEAKLQMMHGIGLEANPIAHFASSVKVDWSIDPERLASRALDIAEQTKDILCKQGIDDNLPIVDAGDVKEIALRTLPPEAMKILIKNSISPLPLHKTLVLIDRLKLHCGEPYYDPMRLALCNALVTNISNLRFGPEVGIGKRKIDVSVVSAWLSEIGKIAHDLKSVVGRTFPSSNVYLADSRRLNHVLAEQSIDAVITSPPYPNEKDYTRTTRLESVLLGYFANMSQLRNFKKTLVRSNTRGVYVQDEDDRWVADYPRIQRIADEIEQRRIELGKTSGFEKLYGRLTKLYFGGMARHFHEMRHVLQPGARLAYVVGDQASYLQVMIRTGQLLAEIAESKGYQVDRIDLFRTRFATATQQELREEVVILTWPGNKP